MPLMNEPDEATPCPKCGQPGVKWHGWDDCISRLAEQRDAALAKVAEKETSLGIAAKQIFGLLAEVTLHKSNFDALLAGHQGVDKALLQQVTDLREALDDVLYAKWDGWEKVNQICETALAATKPAGTEGT